MVEMPTSLECVTQSHHSGAVHLLDIFSHCGRFEGIIYSFPLGLMRGLLYYAFSVQAGMKQANEVGRVNRSLSLLQLAEEDYCITCLWRELTQQKAKEQINKNTCTTVGLR